MMSTASAPAPVSGLCECCQTRPARMLVYLPAADSSPVAPAYSRADLVFNFEDYFRICGAACDPDGTACDPEGGVCDPADLS